MAVYAQLADGRTPEFPDGTDPAIIQSTVKKVIAGSGTSSLAPTTSAPASDAKGIGSLNVTDEFSAFMPAV